jgi:hypothetical protein
MRDARGRGWAGGLGCCLPLRPAASRPCSQPPQPPTPPAPCPPRPPASTDAPDAQESRLAVAKARYAEPKGDDAEAAAGPNAEQERWEREQLARTRLGVGVASAQAARAAEDAAKYELLFEDQIEYVKVRGSSPGLGCAGLLFGALGGLGDWGRSRGCPSWGGGGVVKGRAGRRSRPRPAPCPERPPHPHPTRTPTPQPPRPS